MPVKLNTSAKSRSICFPIKTTGWAGEILFFTSPDGGIEDKNLIETEFQPSIFN